MIYKASVVTTNTSSSTSNGAAWSLIAGASKTARILSVKLNLVSATSSSFALALSGTPGTQTGAVAPISFQTGDTADAALARLAGAWSAAPSVVPGTVLDRIIFPATVGATHFIDFPQGGFSLPSGKELVLYNLATNSTINVTVEIDE